MPKHVLLLERTSGEVAPEEMAALKKEFGEMRFFSRTPQSPHEHRKNCKELGPDVVVVMAPPRPIPTLAMDDGVTHVAFVDGRLMKVVGFEPKYTPL